MGPRLGRVEYTVETYWPVRTEQASMGPRLGRVEYAASVGALMQAITALQWGHA